jgi:SAM-dependent methyltransferase
MVAGLPAGHHHPAKFDALAPGYDGGIGDPLKRLFGASADTFLDQKADWLVRRIRPAGRLLDVGCGTGEFLRAMRRRAPDLELVGCDVARGMIEEARRRWDVGPPPALDAIVPGRLPYGDGEFDVAAAVNVFHHVPADEQLGVLREIVRVVRPAGVAVVIEHNPRNPLTRWLVRRAPIDADAVLLAPARCVALLRAAGATDCRIEYSLFFPPRLRTLWRVEPWLRRCPIGGQYAAMAARGALTAARV